MVRPYRPEDEAALVRLHERGFGGAWPVEMWRWRSAPRFQGDATVMAAFAGNGECVAAMAGVAVPCRCRGVPGFTIAVSNSVLDPGLGRTLLGSRLFLQVVERFVRTFGRAPVQMMYGSPIASLVRAMTVHVGIEVLGDVYALAHDLQGERQRPVQIGSPLRVAQEGAIPADADGLWLRTAGAAATGVERGRAFLTWRFAEHPKFGYEVVTARGAAGELRGLMVLRDGGWRPDVVTICEWIVPDDDAAAEIVLLEHAQTLARQRRASGLAAWFSANAPEHRRWQRQHGFLVRPTSQQIVFRAFERGIDREFLFDHWRFTIADLEFL